MPRYVRDAGGGVVTPRLRVYSAQDHFGPGLMGEPYWYAEVYETTDQRGLWVAGFGSWLEATRGGLLALAERSADVAVPLVNGLSSDAERVTDLLPGEASASGAGDPVALHRGEFITGNADLTEAGEVVVVADGGVDAGADGVDVHASRLPDSVGGCQDSLTKPHSQFWDDLVQDLSDREFRTEWERRVAEHAMDAGPLCACGHAQLEHGETRCKRCACGLAWPGVERTEEHDAIELIRQAEVITHREVLKQWLEATTGLPVVDHRR